MNEIEQKAWDMLTTIEQNVLSLSLSVGLSTWEAGEILGITHYKFLEVKERSEKFFKLFIDYFNEMGIAQIFHPKTVVDERFRDYIDAAINRRLSRIEASNFTGDASLKVTTVQTQHIIRNMERLKGSPIPQDKLTHMLILEFDRWNNKRILPRKAQMPSPYRRRINKREKVYIKYINNIASTRVENMLAYFSYSPQKKSSKKKYIALFQGELFEGGYEVVTIRPSEANIEKLTKLCIYVFNEYNEADVFGYLTATFEERVVGPRKGQKFWPEFRSSIAKAVNFKEINNISFYTNDLESTYNAQLKVKEKPKKNALKRANEEIFYKF